jgi:hypothetical protein
MFGLSSLEFINPWLFSALLLLPLIWWLLRITPPAPREVIFPPIRLLFGLGNAEQTPEATPLWLIFIRLAAFSALIVGLADPLINPQGATRGSGPLLLVIDDGWAAAADWPRRTAAIEAMIARAELENRAISILTTAPQKSGGPMRVIGPFGSRKARGYVAAIRPKPWPVDRVAAIDAIKLYKPNGSVAVIWFSNGLGGKNVSELVTKLQRLGSLDVVSDAVEALPVLLSQPSLQSAKLSVPVFRFDATIAAAPILRAWTADGRLLLEKAANFAIGKSRTEVVFDLPLELRNSISRINVQGQNTAASVVLLDSRWQRRSVGVVSRRPHDSGHALLSEIFYIEHALSPFCEILRQPIAELTSSGRSLIVLPDGENLEAADQADLEAWMRRGGIVLRFSGPQLAARTDDNFTPVPLRRGSRTLGGALLWNEPAKLATFPEASPFFGIEIPTDVTISRQVLAQPSLDLAAKSWANLTDGTPLVTAEKRGEGWLVLVHTTASTEWSNLSLSGLFMSMLRRVVWLSRRVDSLGEKTQPLMPYELLNGFGVLTPPIASVTAIDLQGLDKLDVGPQSPPGYYGTNEVRHALNLTPRLGELVPLADLPSGISKRDYSVKMEHSVGPWFLLVALLLLLIDTVATLAYRGLLTKIWTLGRRGAHMPIVTIIFGLAAVITAEVGAEEKRSPEGFDLEATSSTRLAYILTGVPEVDETSRTGLMGLSNIVRRRTAAELGPPLGVQPNRDELSFFPLIYWPIDVRQKPMPEEAIRRLNRYIENGGTIVLDARDQLIGSGQGTALVRSLTAGLNIPALAPVPPGHVLTKAFYLLQGFPGRWSGNRVWVEDEVNRVNDGVSRMLVGSHDWAAAWSVDRHGQPLYAVVPGGDKQREMAYRFGVNLVMYVLTGNYKADQVHVPAILERLGQ